MSVEEEYLRAQLEEQEKYIKTLEDEIKENQKQQEQFAANLKELEQSKSGGNYGILTASLVLQEIQQYGSGAEQLKHKYGSLLITVN